MITSMFDNPLRMTVVDVDGKTHVIDAVTMTIEGAPPKARGVATLKGDDTPKSRKVYEPAPKTDADIKAVLRGDCDGEDKARTRENQKHILEVLCAMRMRAFKQAACPYTVRDAQSIAAAMGQGVKPSDLARTVIVAAADDFWSQHGDIRPDQIVKHVAALSSRYERERKVNKVIADMRRIDPRAGDELAVALKSKDKDAVATAMREAIARINAAAGGAP